VDFAADDCRESLAGDGRVAWSSARPGWTAAEFGKSMSRPRTHDAEVRMKRTS